MHATTAKPGHIAALFAECVAVETGTLLRRCDVHPQKYGISPLCHPGVFIKLGDFVSFCTSTAAVVVVRGCGRLAGEVHDSGFSVELDRLTEKLRQEDLYVCGEVA